MIEAINTAIANAPLLRGNAEQASVLRSASNQTQVEQSQSSETVKAPYVSPYIFVNTKYNTAVLQIRDSDTGDVIDQFPRETTLQARQRAEQLSSVEPVVIETDDINGSASHSVQQILGDTAAVETVQQASINIGSRSGGNVAQAQIASAALNAGASTAQASTSFSVLA